MIDTQHTSTIFVSALLVIALAAGSVFAVGPIAAEQADDEVGDVVVDYRGCGNTFLAATGSDDVPVNVTVEYADTQTEETETTTIEVERDDLEETPEQVDGEYTLSLNEELADDGTSVIVVSVTVDGETVENPNDCLSETPQEGDGQDDDASDDDQDAGDGDGEADDDDQETDDSDQKTDGDDVTDEPEDPKDC